MPEGLTSAEAALRLAAAGPNAVRTHHAQPLAVLGRQFRSALLLLLLITAVVSAFLGEQVDAAIIGAILAISVGLGFVNEYRAERAVEALHEEIRHQAPALRDGAWSDVDVTKLVPGDVVRLELGMIVPADLRIAEAANLECDESVLTGEAEPVEKSPTPVATGLAIADLSSCVFMGTTVREGSGQGVVVATGAHTAFGTIALALGQRHPETAFQVGLRRFSVLLAWVAAGLTGSIFVVNLLLRRPVIDALLFSLAIAVGITPQLLPAVVTTSLATGSRRLARSKVLVKRLVGIEDLGNVEVLFTDKTGTLTEGRISFQRATDPAGRASDDVLLLGLLANEATAGAVGVVGGNQLDRACWAAPGAVGIRTKGLRRLSLLPFDHDRRMTSVLVEDAGRGRLVVTKGAPESVLDRCAAVPDEARAFLQTEFAAGSRVVAVATRTASGLEKVTPADERDLDLAGFLVFLDPPKGTARDSLARLARLGIEVKIVTGDNPAVAQKVCTDLGLTLAGTLTGAELDALDDDALGAALGRTTIFARVSPEQKSRIIRAQRRIGMDVGFLGDGVNDALALHDADVGISVDSAVDVAKDAADVVLLEKDLGVLANGVVEGRRIFSNTIKYVLMGTSSNFGNMFSAAGASAFLPFLPMLPSQILLNNLLYDAGEMTIPTDDVDEELLERPSRWDIRFIERFMLVFGPASSLFDFVTFALMLGVFHAGAGTFRSGWFVESVCTQTLVIFVIRTRRVPFFRSRPSRPLLVASLATAAIGAVLPVSPLAHVLGFGHLSPVFFLALVLMVAAYLTLAELVKRRFFHTLGQLPLPLAQQRRDGERRIQRRAFRWSH
ncbi:MAG TPA: magnesium-translocating P-type ATPase [Actinomycetota bacterium]|nr:magnesium-translocating P-type ATPase [Actinomycetota bacterium]